jgi:RecJ-like exonuclease
VENQKKLDETISKLVFHSFKTKSVKVHFCDKKRSNIESCQGTGDINSKTVMNVSSQGTGDINSKTVMNISSQGTGDINSKTVMNVSCQGTGDINSKTVMNVRTRCLYYVQESLLQQTIVFVEFMKSYGVCSHVTRYERCKSELYIWWVRICSVKCTSGSLAK